MTNNGVSVPQRGRGQKGSLGTNITTESVGSYPIGVARELRVSDGPESGRTVRFDAERISLNFSKSLL